MDGSCSNTLASATSCLWPIDNAFPSSPTSVCSPLGKSFQPIAIADALCYCCYLRVARLWMGVANVVGYRTGEEERRLWHNAQLTMIGTQIKGANIMSVNQ